MKKGRILTIFRKFGFFMASILTYTAFLYPQMAWGSSIPDIQTSAEQPDANNPMIWSYLDSALETNEKDDRLRWGFHATTTATYMKVTDPATSYDVPAGGYFWILSWTSDSISAEVKYKNQSGTQRTQPNISQTAVVVDGDTYYLFKVEFHSGDTTFRDLQIRNQRRYMLFWEITDRDLSLSVTDEASAYEELDYLNGLYYATKYTPDDPDLAEVLEILYPTEGTTTPATTFDLSFVFYNPDGSQVDKFNIMLFDRIIGKYYFYDDDLPAGEYGEGVYELTLPASTYEATVSLYASTSPDLLRSPVSVTFSVYVDPASILGITDFGELVGLATTTCSISNLAGCFQNALMFVFYPSETVLNKFADLKGIIENKPPFGYVTVYTGQLSELSAEASSTFTLEIEDNIKEKIFDPLRTGLSSILWVCFGFWFFNRIRKQEL